MTIGFSINATAQQPPIPSWIKNTAKWWGEGQISDDEFIKAIQYLIDQKILIITSNAGFSQTQSSVNGGISPVANNTSQTIELSGISYQVTKVETSRGDFYSSKPAGTYIIVHLTIVDLGRTPLHVEDNQFRLIDGKERIFSTVNGFTGKYNIISYEDLQPELPISGVIGFDVPFDSNLEYDLVVYSAPPSLQEINGKNTTQVELVLTDPCFRNITFCENATMKLGLGKDFS